MTVFFVYETKAVVRKRTKVATVSLLIANSSNYECCCSPLPLLQLEESLPLNVRCCHLWCCGRPAVHCLVLSSPTFREWQIESPLMEFSRITNGDEWRREMPVGKTTLTILLWLVSNFHCRAFESANNFA